MEARRDSATIVMHLQQSYGIHVRFSPKVNTAFKFAPTQRLCVHGKSYYSLWLRALDKLYSLAYKGTLICMMCRRKFSPQKTMLVLVHSLIAVAALLPVSAWAARDWEQPCHSGTCHWDTSNEHGVGSLTIVSVLNCSVY